MCTACLAAGTSRRLVLGAGVAALTAAPLVATAQAQPARAVDTPDAALTRLVEGNARYVFEPVLKQPGDDLYQRAVVANVRSNVQRLQQAKPILADMVAAGKLRVVGAAYDLPTGKVALV